MRQIKYFTLIVLLLISINIKGQSCPAILSVSGLQVGIVQIKQLNTQDQQRNTDPISFSQYSLLLSQPMSNSKTILSVSSINVETSTLDLFDITINSITDSEILLTFLYQQTKWNKVSYRYLVTNRSEELYVQMVTLTERQFGFVGIDNSEKDQKLMIFTAQVGLDRAIINEQVQYFKSISFLRGLKYRNDLQQYHPLTINILNTTLTNSTVHFNISTIPKQQNLQLQLLSLSVVYFNPRLSSFTSFGGLVINANFIGTEKVDVLEVDLPGKLYEFYGLSSINLLNNNGILVEGDIDDTFFFNLQATKTIKHIDFTYFVIGLKPTTVCSLCGNKKILAGKQCVSICGDDEKVYIFNQSNQKACIKIHNTSQNSTNSSVNSNQQQQNIEPVQSQLSTLIEQNNGQSFKSIVSAAPIQNHQHQVIPNQQAQNQSTQSDNIIVNDFTYCQNIQHSYWTGQSCHCKVGFVMKQGYCQQISTTIMQEKKPVQNIATNQNISNQIQTQQPKEVSSNTLCSTNLEVFNSQTQKCQCINGLNYMQDSSTQSLSCVKCKDFEGFFSQNGMCRYCGQNRIYDSSLLRCKCKDGFYELQSGQCHQNTVKNNHNVQISNANIQESQPQHVENQQNQNISEPNISTNSENTTSKETDANIQHQNISTQPIVNNSSQNITQNQTTVNNLSSNQVTPNNFDQFRYGSDIPQITGHIINPYNSTSVVSNNLTQSFNTSEHNHNVSQTATNNTQVSQTQKPNDPIVPQNPPLLNSVASQVSPHVSKNCMKLLSTPQLNTANLFITLGLPIQKTFHSEEEMRNFLQSEFNPSIYKPSSIYCNQQQENKKTFECLLLYPSGIPNEKFQIDFWYNDQQTGQKCSVNIFVDPLESAAKSLRTSRKRI